MSNEEILNEQSENVVADQAPADEADGHSTQGVTGEERAVEEQTVQEQAAPQKTENKPRSASRIVRTAEQKRKLFGMIYYPVLALLLMLMLVFSAIDGVYGYGFDAYGADYYKSVNSHIDNLAQAQRSVMAEKSDVSAHGYIVSALTSGGFYSMSEQKTERDDNADKGEPLAWIKTVTEYATDGNSKKPTVTLQTSTLDASLQTKLELSEYLVGKSITNIVAAVPSNAENAGAVVITVRYDTRPDTFGAASNGAFVGNAVQSLIELVKSGAKLDNDIIVVFTEDVDYSYGAYAFFNLFDGLSGAVARAKYGINLDAYGNGGTLALTDISGADVDYISAVAKTTGNAFNSSVVPDSIAKELINRDAVKAFGKIPAVQVSVIGGLDAAQSSLDTAKNISQSIVKQQSQLLKSYIYAFGKNGAKYGNTNDGKTTMFSYLGGTVAYGSVVAYVLGGVILAQLAAAITLAAVKKTFPLKNMLFAGAMQLLVVFGTALALLAAYFLVTLMLTGFGVLPLHSILLLRYSNAGIIIAALLITLAASFGFTSVFKKMFGVTSSDAVRGTALLVGFAGAVLSFVCPEYSFMLSWLAVLMLAVLIVSICTHKKFKAKFGFGLDKLYPYAIPVVFALPLVMAPVVALAQLLPLVLLPVIFMPVTALFGVGVPYLDRTQPILDKIAKKIKHTVRIEHTVTERIEDRAKKGKFTEITYRRVDKEKVSFNYKNYFGISVVSVLAIVTALLSGGFGVTFDKSLAGYFAYGDAVYNDSLVYELDYGTKSEVSSQKLVVGDLMAYKQMRYNFDGLVWTGVRYEKSVGYTVSNIVDRSPSVEKNSDNNNLITVTTFDGAFSNVTITVPSAKSITKITIKETRKTDGDYAGYVYEFDNLSTITLRLPHGFDTSFTLEFEGAMPTQLIYEEHRTDAAVKLESIDEWNMVYDKADMPGLKAAIVLKRTFTL